LDLGILLFLAMMLAMTLIRAPLTLNRLPVAQIERPVREKMLLLLVMICMMFLPAIFATPLLDIAAYRPGAPILVFGAVSAVLGLWLRYPLARRLRRESPVSRPPPSLTPPATLPAAGR
jgi:hypothetical protein